MAFFKDSSVMIRRFLKCLFASGAQAAKFHHYHENDFDGLGLYLTERKPSFEKENIIPKPRFPGGIGIYPIWHKKIRSRG